MAHNGTRLHLNTYSAVQCHTTFGSAVQCRAQQLSAAKRGMVQRVWIEPVLLQIHFARTIMVISSYETFAVPGLRHCMERLQN